MTFYAEKLSIASQTLYKHYLESGSRRTPSAYSAFKIMGHTEKTAVKGNVELHTNSKNKFMKWYRICSFMVH